MKPNTLQFTVIAMLIATRLFARSHTVDGNKQTLLTPNRQFLAKNTAEECSSHKVILSMVKNSLRKTDKRLLEDVEITDCTESNGTRSSKNISFNLSFGSFICPESFSVSYNSDAAKNKRFSTDDLRDKLAICSNGYRKSGKTPLQNGDKQLSGVKSSHGKQADYVISECKNPDAVYFIIINMAAEEHLAFPKNLKIVICRIYTDNTFALFQVAFQHITQICGVYLEVTIDQYGRHISDDAREIFIKDVRDCMKIKDYNAQVSAQI